METQTLNEQIDINENAPRIEFKQQKLSDLVDTACALKRQIDELSTDLEEIKTVFREIAFKEMDSYAEKTIFSGTIGNIEVLDDTRTVIEPGILKAFLENKGKGNLLLKFMNVKITEVRNAFGNDTVAEIGTVDFKPRSKVYIKPRKK